MLKFLLFTSVGFLVASSALLRCTVSGAPNPQQTAQPTTLCFTYVGTFDCNVTYPTQEAGCALTGTCDANDECSISSAETGYHEQYQTVQESTTGNEIGIGTSYVICKKWNYCSSECVTTIPTFPAVCENWPWFPTLPTLEWDARLGAACP